MVPWVYSELLLIHNAIQVKYVFSDKTGTLTQNKMVFHQCSIRGTVYSRAGEGELLEELDVRMNCQEQISSLS